VSCCHFARIPHATVRGGVLQTVDVVKLPPVEVAEIELGVSELHPCTRGKIKVGSRIAVLGGAEPIGTLASVIEIIDVGNSPKYWAVADFTIPYGTTLNDRIAQRRGLLFMEDDAIVISE
jgi:hypothetical protein